MTIGERFNSLMKSQGLSIQEFSLKTGIGEKNTYNYVGDKTVPNSDTMEKVFRNFPGLNAAWLLTGEGEMLLSDIGNPVQKSPEKNTDTDILLRHLDESNKTLAYFRDKLAYLEDREKDGSIPE